MARLDEGFPTLVKLDGNEINTDVLAYEKEVQPIGISAGGAIDTTTMRTDETVGFRTMAPKKLHTATEATLTVAYDESCYSEMVREIGVNQLITITFPDEGTLTFWGWMDEFTPNALVEGEQPTATMTLIPSMVNTSQAEVALGGTTMA